MRNFISSSGLSSMEMRQSFAGTVGVAMCRRQRIKGNGTTSDESISCSGGGGGDILPRISGREWSPRHKRKAIYTYAHTSSWALHRAGSTRSRFVHSFCRLVGWSVGGGVACYVCVMTALFLPLVVVVVAAWVGPPPLRLAGVQTRRRQQTSNLRPATVAAAAEREALSLFSPRSQTGE